MNSAQLGNTFIYKNDGMKVARWDRDSASLYGVTDKTLRELYHHALKIGMGQQLGEDDDESFLLSSDNGHLFEAVLRRHGYCVGSVVPRSDVL